jgi:hypothetical protein
MKYMYTVTQYVERYILEYIFVFLEYEFLNKGVVNPPSHTLLLEAD